MLANDLLRGVIQVRDRASLRNPGLKILMLVTTLILSVMEFSFWSADSCSFPSISQQCLISLILVVATSVDLRMFGWGRFLRRSLVFSIVLIGVSLAASGEVIFLEILWNRFLGVWSIVPVLRKIEGSTWLGIVDLYAAFLAASNLSTRDFIWVGRRLLLPAALPIYQVFIVTTAVLASAAPRIGAEVYWIARMRSRLLQNPSCKGVRGSSFSLFFNVAANALLYRFTYVAQVVERLLDDRGFFRMSYIEPIELRLSASDVVALVLLVVGMTATFLARI